uniref:hypothetical protein n=1 Tax=Paractinoplanes polyasparticus TaxID=2856853 RepID=UPI001C852431|nr:hypothetical protein [Actinoplanes polyasparticus]
MRTLIGRGLTAAALLAGATLGAAAPAQAAEPGLTVSATRLVFEPGEHGYTGTYHVTVTNTGSAAVGAAVKIVEPVAGAFRQLRPGVACMFAEPVDGRRTLDCDLPGGSLAPGQVRKFRVDAEALTTPRDYAMQGNDTLTTVYSLSDSAQATASSPTLFRSTTGVLRNPQPYVQDRDADITATAGDVTLTPNGEGVLTGRVPVTIRWNGDAGHSGITTETVVPAPFEARGAGPDNVCMYPYCDVSGPMYPGQTIGVELEVEAPADTPSGTVTTGSIRVYAPLGNEQLSEDTPDVAVAPFRITVG